ncbi:MAG: ABC transporter permease, partial [Deltaproteobacteria bacterium]|nr:ABC transporter permease [Deltaproteobacteria bacterium]
MKTWNRFKNSYLLYSFKRDPIAILSFSVLSILVVISILAPVVAPFNAYDPSTFDIMDSETPPVWMEGGDELFIFGTDIQGRDLLSAMIYGLRVSLLIGCGAVLLQAFMGIQVGLFS